jgi:hypothetical protein
MTTQKYCLRYPLTNAKSPIEQGAIHSIYQSYFEAHEAQDQIYYNTKVILSITSYS